MESCTIKLTSGAIDNKKLNVRICDLDFFPAGIIEELTKKNALDLRVAARRKTSLLFN